MERKRSMGIRFFVLLMFFIFFFCGGAFAAERIITTSPHLTEIVYDLGLEKKVVGVTDNCNYPIAAASKPKIGRMDVNIEKIVRLRPDLILVDRAFHPQLAERLKRFPVLTVDCGDMEGFRSSVLKIGKAAGAETNALRMLSRMDARFFQLDRKVRALPAKKSVFVEIWDAPLMSCGRNSLIDDIVRRAGGVNVCRNMLEGYGRVNAEAVFRTDPDAVLLTTSSAGQIAGRALWKNLTAVRQGRVYRINSDRIARPSFRMADAAEEIFRFLYPELRL